MLSEDLVDFLPKKKYCYFPKNNIFFGFKIKNLYDEKRININSTYDPTYYKLTDRENDYYYGICLKPKLEYSFLLENLKDRKEVDLISYCNFLEKLKLNCEESFFYFNPPVYPLDTENIKKYIPDFKYNNFISFKEEIPMFQQFSALIMLAVI
jgi:hypothetical protein